MKPNLFKAGIIAFSLLSMNAISSNAQTINLSQNSTGYIDAWNTPACNNGSFTGANSYYRAFKISDYVNAASFTVDSVLFAVDFAVSGNGNGQPITVKLHSSSAQVPALSSLTELSTLSGTIPDFVNGGGVMSATMNATIPGSGILVVELACPDGIPNQNFLLIGSNTDYETKPSYWRGPACNYPNITDINASAIAPTQVSLLMNVYGHANYVTQPDAFVNPTNPVCDKNTVTYSVPSVAGVTYNWSYSGTGVSISNSGTNSAVLTFATGATSGNLSVTATAGSTTSAPRTLALTVNPSPVATISRAGNVLTATSGFASYAWYRNNLAITGATNSTYAMTQNGNYYVKVTASGNTCTGNSDVATIDDVVGIADIELANEIKVYPNPVRDMVTIESPVYLDAAISKIDGRQILIMKNAKKIDLKSLSAGIYFLTLTDKNGIVIKNEKLVKTN